MRLHHFSEKGVHSDDGLLHFQIILEAYLIIDHQYVHAFLYSE